MHQVKGSRNRKKNESVIGWTALKRESLQIVNSKNVTRVEK